MTTHPGILIVFDGIDGAGKTTQANLLADALTFAGEEVVMSKEPTDGQWGAKLRASATAGRLPFEEELEAFINDRQEHLAEKIIPALQAGKTVILDRYFYSTIAYQGIRCDDVTALESRVRHGVLVPDAWIFLEIAPEVAAYRIDNRDGKANHFEDLNDLRQIDRLFREIAARETAAHHVDGTPDAGVIHTRILSLLASGTLKNKRCAKHYGCDDPVMCGYRMTDACPWWRIVGKLRSRAPELKIQGV